MGERRGTKALELWCRRITEGYPGVNVQNMTTSWRDGLAFCAMIHHFRPDLIDFSSLNKDDIYGNNELAFRTAEQHLGIPALLDAEDMASCSVPDRLSILTYLSQFYQVLGGSSPSRLPLKRSTESSSERIGSVPESPQPKQSVVALPDSMVSSRLGMRREPCASCGLPVFLAEKLVVARSVYHRSCFRCARCQHQLTPGNYYETEDGQYCCEACPMDEADQDEEDDDEQPAPQLTTTTHRELPDEQQQSTSSTPSRRSRPSRPPDPDPDAALLEAPLSDEEKSKRRSLERSVDALLLKQCSRLDLVASHLLAQQSDDRAADEEKSARSLLREAEEPRPRAVVPEDENDEKFDEMIKMINERIDKLISEEEQKPAVSSAAQLRPQAVERRRASCDDGDDASRQEMEEEPRPALRRSSSLRSAGKHTKDREPRRLSLVQRRLRLFEPEPELAASAVDSSLAEKPSAEKSKPKKKAKHEDGDYPEELNPFASDDELDQQLVVKSAKKPPPTNPFGSSSDEEAEPPPKPATRTKKRLIEAPQINLNPFWSDDELPGDSGAESEPELRSKGPPVPKPRTLRHSHLDGGLRPKSNLTSSSIHSSNASIASITSCSTITPGGTYRKKKTAPPPPILNQSSGSTPSKLLNTSASSNSSISPRLTPRTRKSKPAPPPPVPAAQSINGNEWDEEKLSKDEANRTMQSLSCADGSAYLGYSPDKSVEGKWKRKKGPAPPRPMPLRRKIKVISMKDVKLELDQIEMQQQGLEKQGVRLEQIIRDKCESGTASEDTSLGLDVEELVLELFALVNEKNELFRRQAELMLLRRQQRLEDEHADIEYQVRCLIAQPEATKTDFDKQREETLIQRLVEIVERRNEIVECLEMDRKREIEEDRSIHREMDLYAARNKMENINMTDESRRSSKFKKGKVKEKTKEKKSKKSSKKDADKDVDETETKQKRHSLRKWF